MQEIDLSALHNLESRPIPNADIVDGDHIIVRCSNCRKPLCDAWITQPKLKLKTNLTASCDYCGGASSTVKVEGKFQLAGTDDSGMADIKHDFVDNDDKNFIYQKMHVITKRRK